MDKTDNIIFDFDMTLGFRTTMWTDTVKELLLENNVFASSEQIRPVTHGNVYPWSDTSVSHSEFFKEKSWWEAVGGKIAKGLIENNICDSNVAYTVATQLPARFADFRYWKLFPDTLDTLEKLKKQGYRLRLLSNHIPEARSIFNRLGLDKYFELMVISSEQNYEKPQPQIFDIVCDGLNKNNTVLVGDNYFADILGALNYGLNAVMVRKPNITNYKYYCKTLYQLPVLLKGKDNAIG